MELAIIIVSVVFSITVLALVVLVYFVLRLMTSLPHSPTLPYPTAGTEIEPNAVDKDHFQESNDGTVPLDQFTPDFDQPMKIIHRKDSENNDVVEEVPDDGDKTVKNYA